MIYFSRKTDDRNSEARGIELTQELAASSWKWVSHSKVYFVICDQGEWL